MFKHRELVAGQSGRSRQNHRQQRRLLRSKASRRHRVPRIEYLEDRMVLSAGLLLDELQAFRMGDKGEASNALAKVGYDLASTYAYFQDTGTAPPEAIAAGTSSLLTTN